MAGGLIGALRVTLGLDSAEFTRGTKKAQAEMSAMQKHMSGLKSVAGGLAAGLAAVGVTTLITDAFAMASALQEAADAAGVTVEQLQRLRLAAQQNGATAEQMDTALKKLSVRLGEAKTGSSSAIAAFTALGISMDQLKNLNAGDAFALIAAKIAAIKDPTLQAAYANDIYGKSFANLLPTIKGGTAALDEATAASKRNGEISTQDAKKLDELADSWDMFKTRLGVATANLIASLSTGATAFNDYGAKVHKWGEDVDAAILGAVNNADSRLSEFANTVKNALGNALSAFADLNVRAVKYIANMVASVGSWISGKLGAIFDGAIVKIDKVGNAFYVLYDKVVGHSYVPDMVEGVNHWFGLMEKGMIGSTTRATQSATEMMQAMRDKVGDLLNSLFPEASAIRAVEGDIKTLNDAFAAGVVPVTVYRAALDKLKAELADLQSAAKKASLPPLPESYGNGEDGPTDIGPAIDELQKKLPTIGGKVKTTFTDMARHVQNTAATIANAISDMQGAMSGFVNAIKKGDIVGIIGGLANTIGAVLGAIGSIKNFSAGGAGGVPGYANGTNFHPGGLAMVGERGRELVQLPRGSKVFPNGKGPTGMSGGKMRVDVVPSPYFDVRVAEVSTGVVADAGPTIARGGAALAQRQTAIRRRRSLA